MTRTLKMFLSAASVAALLASPAAAKTQHHQQSTSLVTVPADAQASVRTYQAVTVYAPDVKAVAHPGSVNPDFQLSTDK